MNRLHKLAVNEEGFVFDPSTGESFTVNQTGLRVMKLLKENQSSQIITKELMEEYEVSSEEAEKDVADFIDHLRSFQLWEGE